MRRLILTVDGKRNPKPQDFAGHQIYPGWGQGFFDFGHSIMYRKTVKTIQKNGRTNMPVSSLLSNTMLFMEGGSREVPIPTFGQEQGDTFVHYTGQNRDVCGMYLKL